MGGGATRKEMGRTGIAQFYNRDEETRTIEWGSVIEWVREWEAKEPVNADVDVDADVRSPVWWMTEGEWERKKEKEEVYKFTPNIQILSFSLSALRLAFALQAGKHKCIK